MSFSGQQDSMDMGCGFVQFCNRQRVRLCCSGNCTFICGDSAWELVFGREYLLGQYEVVSKYDIASIVFIVCGLVLTVIGSDHRPNECPLPRLINHYEEPKVIVLLAILASIVAASLIAIHLDFVARKTRVSLDDQRVIERPSKTTRALYVIVGSVVGNFTALFGKAFAGLLVFTFSGQDQFNNQFVVVIILVFVVSLPLQIYLINASLAVNDILYHIPNFYVFWNIGNILTGAIFYEETAHLTGSNWAFYLVGVLLLFGGVLCKNIATARKQQFTNSC